MMCRVMCPAMLANVKKVTSQVNQRVACLGEIDIFIGSANAREERARRSVRQHAGVTITPPPPGNNKNLCRRLWFITEDDDSQADKPDGEPFARRGALVEESEGEEGDEDEA